MPTIIRRENKIIDTNYYSKCFGWVEMDITNVEAPPTKETYNYILESRNRKAGKDEKQVIKNGDNGKKCI